ncbi:DUF2127 domain-containing protein [soil metagenome]
MKLPAPLRLVAVFEAAKGALVLLAGLGLLAMVHRDLQNVAAHVVGELNLNPSHHYPQLFISAAAHVTQGRRWLLVLFAVLYALVRAVEAYGLWHARRWAELFAALSGSIYIPVELYELFHKPSALALAALMINAAIVLLMLRALRQGAAAH